MVGTQRVNRTKLRHKGALSQAQATRPKGRAGLTFVQKMDRLEELKATKEMILREAEYVLAVLSEDKSFWKDMAGDDAAGDDMVCQQCGKAFDPRAIYLSLVSSDGYMLPDGAQRFLCGEGCPYCRPDLFAVRQIVTM